MKTKRIHKTPEATALQLEDIADDLLERGRAAKTHLSKNDYYAEGGDSTVYAGRLQVRKPYGAGLFKTLSVMKLKNGEVVLGETVYPDEGISSAKGYSSLDIKTEYSTESGVMISADERDNNGDFAQTKSIEDLATIRSEAGRIVLELQDELRTRVG